MLACHDVTVTYRQGRGTFTPLQGVSLSVGAESVAVTGPSGSGKTTLLRILAGLQSPDEGGVEIDGTPVRSADLSCDPRVSLIHQDYRLVEFLTVAENLQLACELRTVALDGRSVSSVLETVGLGDFGDRWPGTLSGGEQQRVAIARSLIVGSQVILADEPTGALDIDNSRLVAELLHKLAESEGVTVVVATHDLGVAGLMSRRVTFDRGALSDQDGIRA